MDKDEYAAALAELAALGDARVAADAALKALSEQSVAAVLDALKRGIRPADVARSLHYTDGYVRKIGRPKGVQPDPRYAHLKPPSRAKSAPESTAAPVVTASNPFLPPAPAAAPSEEQERLVMKDLRNNQSRWFKTAWQATDGLKGRERTQKILTMAVEAGHLTPRDLDAKD